jgi:hypothetical protein
LCGSLLNVNVYYSRNVTWCLTCHLLTCWHEHYDTKKSASYWIRPKRTMYLGNSDLLRSNFSKFFIVTTELYTWILCLIYKITKYYTTNNQQRPKILQSNNQCLKRTSKRKFAYHHVPKIRLNNISPVSFAWNKGMMGGQAHLSVCPLKLQNHFTDFSNFFPTS